MRSKKKKKKKKKKKPKKKVATRASAIVETARRAKAAALARKEAKLAALIALVRRRKDRIVEDFYDIGEALRTIVREKLYEARGTTFEELLDRELGIGRTNAFQLIAIVDQLPRDRAIELGQEKSYALVTYASATPADDTPLGLLERGKIGRKAIGDLGANDIKRAASSARKKSRPVARIPAETRQTIRDLVGAVRALGLPRPRTTLRGRELTMTIRLPEPP